MMPPFDPDVWSDEDSANYNDDDSLPESVDYRPTEEELGLACDAARGRWVAMFRTHVGPFFHGDMTSCLNTLASAIYSRNDLAPPWLGEHRLHCRLIWDGNTRNAANVNDNFTAGELSRGDIPPAPGVLPPVIGNHVPLVVQRPDIRHVAMGDASLRGAGEVIDSDLGTLFQRLTWSTNNLSAYLSRVELGVIALAGNESSDNEGGIERVD
jgi:hypothetical protein